MSHLIRSRKVVSNVARLIPLPPTSAATALAKMDHVLVNPVDLIDPVGPVVSQVLASSAVSVVQPVSARCGHRRPHTPDISASNIDSLGS
ncbi:hypothetical protein ACFX2F_029874 [Malus domestica]